jgi:hypothetical protein
MGGRKDSCEKGKSQIFGGTYVGYDETLAHGNPIIYNML